MFKLFATNCIVSKGYDGAPALRFSESGDAVQFRIGQRVYDSRAENNTRWVNLHVKAFGQICERIRKMQLKEGSVVNLVGRYDEDSWVDKSSGAQKTAPVLVLDEIEYASGGGKSKDAQKSGQESQGAMRVAPAPQTAPAMSGNFTGYESFGTGSFFDMNG